jgi:pimeloyl-ACP methyl ester carboxylesterase
VAYLEVDGTKLRYKMAGSGAPILLLHGWGGSIESMGIIFDDFVRDHTVIAFDFPGHGESSLPSKAWGVAEFAESVRGVMDALHVQCPHIIWCQATAGMALLWAVLVSQGGEVCREVLWQDRCNGPRADLSCRRIARLCQCRTTP